ncbi:MAG: OmpA family protein [Candidatus Kapabacteria bacterium]|nr:OmpA family protein [Candidatus Kapabacteria bacterium]
MFPAIATAQTQQGRISLAVRGSTYKYWGEFTDDQYGWGGEGALRYEAFRWLGAEFNAGVGSTAFRVTPYDLAAFPEYYQGRTYGEFYPGTLTTISRKNDIRLAHYELLGVFHLFPSSRVIPQLIAGVGLMNHYPTNAKEHSPLPNIVREAYPRYSIHFPVGIGFEYFLNDDVSLNGRAMFRLTTTDNLDDVTVEGTPNDYYATIGGGLNYYIHGDLDSDGDGVSDSEERRLGLDPRNSDSDGDGLSDYEELNVTHTDPKRADSDGDGLTDKEEILFKSSPIKMDTDGDGLYDFPEFVRKTDPNNPDTDGDTAFDGDEVHSMGTNPLKADSDGDGLRDAEEAALGTNPLMPDTDGDGLGDGTEVNDVKSNPLKIDTDGDGLSDADEFTVHKTDPRNPDTDGDMLMDGEEVVRYKTNPKVADTDMDGWSDGEEVLRRCTNPANPDTDGDGIIDPKDPDPCALSCCCCGGKKTESAPPAIPTPAPVPKLDEKKAEEPKQPKKKRNFSIRFLKNSDQIDNTDPETQRSIKELKDYLTNECDKLRVTFEGHTSAEGNPNRNKVLSEMRSRAVRQLMTQQGITPDKIQGTVGYGSSMPLIPEPGKSELKRMRKDEVESIRKQNRRITVREDVSCD